jgi:enolase
MSKITSVTALEILDSNSNPTLRVQVTLDDGSIGVGTVPSGASAGSSEAIEIRDGDERRYRGKGVLRAVQIVNSHINEMLVGMDASDQSSVDQAMIDADGTANKSKLGGNVITGTSIAVLRAAAQSAKQPLYKYISKLSNMPATDFSMPQPLLLIMEGGKHGNWATDIQEFMIRPKMEAFPNFAEMLRAGSEIFHTLGKILDAKGYDTGVGFEGAYAPVQLKSNEEALDLIIEAISQAGYQPEEEFTLALDVAASEFYEDGNYVLKSEGDRTLTAQEWGAQLTTWIQEYPLYSIEDPFHEESWADWSAFVAKHGAHCQVVGDDLVTTNTVRIQKAIELKSMNAVLIKINQIGTITETLAAIKLGLEHGMPSIISHRSGETNDDTIADLVVGTAATQCKFGGPDRGERVAKYNRLLVIEDELHG